MITENDSYRCIGTGTGPAGLAAAFYFGPDIVFGDGKSSAPFSNEHVRFVYHPDHPETWSDLVERSDEILRFGPPTEMTGYLLQAKPENTAALETLKNRLLTYTPARNLQFSTPAVDIWNAETIAEARRGNYCFIPPNWETALFTSGGKIWGGLDRLTDAYPLEQIRDGHVRRITNGHQNGLLILEVKNGDTLSTIQTKEAVIAVGPFISQVDLSEVDIGFPSKTLPEGLHLPRKTELPPGKVQIQSVINLDFSEELLIWISSITALRLMDPIQREQILKSVPIDPKTFGGWDTLDQDKLDIIATDIKTYIEKELQAYGQNGPLLQNFDKVYVTRTNPTYKTQQAEFPNMNYEKYIKEGSWRKIMLGKESDEPGDLSVFPPHDPLHSDATGSIAKKNLERRNRILKDSKGLMFVIDALIAARDLVESESSLLNDILPQFLEDFKRLLDQSMPIQSGFYHLACGMDVKKESLGEFQPLMEKYIEILDQADDTGTAGNRNRLKNAGIDADQMIDSPFGPSKPLSEYKYPFAVWSIFQNHKSNIEGTYHIPDVDLPYMDVLEINGALVSVIGWLRGRGYMAGPGAARVLHDKYRLITNGEFDPESDFAKYMEQFSILRMYNPPLMDKLLEEKILGGSGDI